ncbi:MAG: hypothetical protein WD069_03275 [Planctomycetales bacterium]
MNLSRRLLAIGLAVSLAWVSMPFAVLGQERVDPPPTDESMKEQATRLDPKNSVAGRLEAIAWLNRHSEAHNAHLAIPALERCIRDDREARVRAYAIESLALIAGASPLDGAREKPEDSCPVVIIEAMLDEEEMVRQFADVYAGQFASYAPGSLDVLLRCAKSENVDVRADCVSHLARAGSKDERALEGIERAKKDESFAVRHNAHVAMFQATDDLAEHLAYLIRLQEDPDGVLGQVDPDSEVGRRELTIRNLACIGAAMSVVKWSDERPDDLAPALLGLLADPSPEMRRGAARLIGASAVKVDLALHDGKNSLEPPPVAAKAQQPPQRSNVAVRFEKLKAEDRLRELRDDDPDRTVRAAARMALGQLATVREKGPPR